MDASFRATLIEWRGPAPFYWLPLPDAVCDLVQEQAAEASYGWGAVPVSVQIGGAEWETSLLPRQGGYMLPIKKIVRTSQRLSEGDSVTVTMTVAPRGGRPAGGLD